MDLLIGIITGFLALILLVVIHEFGHAIAAIKSGVDVEEFGVGLPPSAWKKKLKNGIVFSLNWLPIGGFVKLKGEYDSASGKGDYGAAGFWGKTKILFAGVFFNWVFAAVILTILAVFGMPSVIDGQFYVKEDTTVSHGQVTLTSLTEGHGAKNAGLEVGDIIIRFDDVTINNSQQFIDLISENKGQIVPVIYERDGNKYSTSVSIGTEASGGYFGAGLAQKELMHSTWSAPITGIITTGQFTLATFQGLGTMVSNLVNGIILQFSSNSSDKDKAATDLKSVSDSVSGPIGILGTIFPQARQAGLNTFLFLLAIVSISLAAMNVLPIPALDGGRWLLMFIYAKILRRKLTKENEEKIQSIGFMVLMALMLIVTIVDVKKIL